MELLSLKIIVLTISGAVRLFFGLLPLVLLKTFNLKPEKGGIVKKIISLLMFFGGGVLLATCFLHMMPHVRESFTEANVETPIPLPEVIFLAGFFFVYMLEDIVHGFIHKRNKRKAHNKLKESAVSIKQQHHHQSRHNNNGVNNLAYNGQSETSLATPKMIPRIKSDQFNNNKTPIFTVGSVPDIKVITPGTKNDKIKASANEVGTETEANGIVGTNFTYIDPEWLTNSQINLITNSTYTVRSNSLYDIPLGTPNSNGQNNSGIALVHQGNKIEFPGGRNINPIEYDAGSSSFETSSGSGEVSSAEEGHHGHNHGHDHHHDHDHSHLPPVDDDDSITAAIRNLLIVVAISFHGIFEGMAIGLQTTEKDVWYLFLAVSLHECTILFCIGVELISSKTKILKMLLYIVIVSLVCPIGMAIGIIVSESQSSVKDIGNLVLIGSLQGLGAGTLLYVAFFEIFAAEGKHLKRKYLHIIVAIIGFIFMGALEIIGGHSHGGSGNGHGHSHSKPLTAAAKDDHSDHDHDEHAPNGFHSNEDDGREYISGGGHGHGHSHSH